MRAASLGVVADFGTAILAWDHYQALLLIPALWLVTRRGHWFGLRGLSLAILVYVAVGARVYGFLFDHEIHFPWYGRYSFVFQSFVWLPLWVHLLAETVATPSPVDQPD